MSEGRFHISLVEAAKKRLQAECDEDTAKLIRTDSPDSPRPATIFGNIIPDIYYQSSDLLLLGEAKTPDDLVREHTVKQLKAYVSTCESFSGKSRFILAVDWKDAFTARDMLKRLLPADKKGEYIVLANSGHEIKL